MSRFIVRGLALTLMLAAAPALAQDKVQKPAQVQMKAAVTAYFDAMNSGDAAKASALFAPGAMIEDPLGSPAPAEQVVTRVIGGKPNFQPLLLTGSNANYAAAAVHMKNIRGELNAMQLFTFDPNGKITDLKVYLGSEDRKR